jgi:8-hydroxy-5-deazaflavin:NADPH oxidoreductase
MKGKEEVKIGILGTGGVGRTLAAKLISLGHEVVIGTRNVEDTLARTAPDGMGGPPFKVWHSQNPKVKLVKFSEAASFGEILFLATFGDKTAEAISLAGKQNFDNKLVLDTTNPLDFSKGVPPKFTVTLGNSLGEQIQKHIPNAKVVKAFNTIGAHIMVNPNREEGSPDLFIAGNDSDTKKIFSSLAEQMGWQSVIDLGDISQSYWLEANAMLWIHYGFKYNSWNHAFKLLKK